MLTDRILFTDAEAILIDKPAGLPVDTPRNLAGSVESALETLRLGFQRPPSIVHRLDRDTSGVLLLARTDKAHRRYSLAFEAGLAVKTYVAVVDGIPQAIEGRIDLPLSKVSTREEGWRIVPDPRGKPAVTGWRVLGEVDGRALIEFRPETGRTHQLRVHAAAALGVPILGDPVYGAGGDRMLLHALSLSLPREGKAPVAGTAVPPAGFDPWRHLIDPSVFVVPDVIRDDEEGAVDRP